MKLPIAALILALPVLAAAQSPTIWRCGADGRSYADLPCSQGRQLALADSRPTADVQAARERAAQEQRAADTLLRERLQREAAQRSLVVATDRPATAVKPSGKSSDKAKRRSVQLADPGTFRATAPASRHRKG